MRKIVKLETLYFERLKEKPRFFLKHIIFKIFELPQRKINNLSVQLNYQNLCREINLKQCLKYSSNQNHHKPKIQNNKIKTENLV